MTKASFSDGSDSTQHLTVSELYTCKDNIKNHQRFLKANLTIDGSTTRLTEHLIGQDLQNINTFLGPIRK